MYRCNQDGCEEVAAFRFTWPGRDEAGICAEHAPKAKSVAGALGLHLQLIPLDPPESDGDNDPDSMLSDGDPGEP